MRGKFKGTNWVGERAIQKREEIRVPELEKERKSETRGVNCRGGKF